MWTPARSAMDSLSTRLAIMMHTRLYEITIELIDHALTALLELLTVGIGPPICRMSLQVVGSPQAVDEVRQIMRDCNAERAIVDRIRGVGIEERRLQLAGGKTIC